MPRRGQIGRRKQSTPTRTVRSHEIVVSTKKAWGGDWEIQPNLTALSATFAVAPSVSQATLIHDFGNVRGETDGVFTTRDPLELRDHYVKIELFSADEDRPVNVGEWIGVITTSTRSLHGREGNDPPNGRQTFTALGLESLLQKMPIDRTWFKQNESFAQNGKTAVAFNQRNDRGLGVRGNRSSLRISPDNVYVFEDNDDLWRGHHIVNYLLNYFVNTRTTPQFKHAEAQSPLAFVIDTYNLFGMTVFDALNVLVDRRRGLGWKIRTDGEADSPIDVHVFSILDEPVSIGSVTLPANPNQVTKRLDPDIYVEEFQVVDSADAHFSEVLVRGAPIVVMFSISYKAGNLTAGWSTTQQDEYEDAAKGVSGYSALSLADKQKRNDQFRQQDFYRGVFVEHHIPDDFDWMVGDNISSTTPWSAAPVARADGTIEIAPSLPPDVLNMTKRLLSRLPILQGVDYSTSPPTIKHNSGNRVEFLPPFALIDVLNQYKFVDRTIYGGDRFDFPNATIQTLGNVMGVRLTVAGSHPNHAYFKRGESITFDLAQLREPSEFINTIYNSLDYARLITTVAVEIDERPFVRLDTAQTLDNNTTLVIDLPNIRYWYAARNTVLGPVDFPSVAQLKRIHQDNLVLRDDTADLRAIAGFIKGWYIKPRRSVVIRRRTMEYVEPGSLLLSVAFGDTTPTNSVITEVTWDLVSQTTQINSGFAELDIRAVFGGV